MRRVPLSATLGCLLIIPTTLALNSCIPIVVLKDYPDTWAKLDRLSKSNDCSEVEGTYLDEGTADDGTAVSLHHFLRTRGNPGVLPGIVKLRFDKSGILEVEARAGDQRDKPGLAQARSGWKCTTNGVKFHVEGPQYDMGMEWYNLYLLPSTDGTLVVRRVNSEMGGYGISWVIKKRSWFRFPSAE